MDAFLLIKWLHILSAMLLFGTGLGTAFHMWMAHRGGEPMVIAAAARSTVRADWLFTLPSGIVQPVSGLALVIMGGYAFDETWLVATWTLYLIAGSCWLVVVWLQIRAADLAAHAATTGAPLPPGYYRAMRWWYRLGWPAFLALIVVVWMMVNKPQLAAMT